MKDLIKRIIDTCNYNEMAIDSELSIEFVCDIVEPLHTKDIEKINSYIIEPLMSQYRDAEDNKEMDYIKETIRQILEYIKES